MSPAVAAGPLHGLRVVEIAGLGPSPHACMILADLGADVIRIERAQGQPLATGPSMLLNRGRPSVALDLKHPDAVRTVQRLVRQADALVEGMRPGVMERLGLGPDDLLAVQPRLVYGRMTGWGQSGPLSLTAGHDINYVSVSGVLHGLGQDRARPQFPMNLVGDFGGGSTYLVIGLLAALLEAGRTGVGQVVDAAIVDGAAHLSAMTLALLASGEYSERRATNLLDGGVPYYDVYETADGRYMSVGALEPQFFAVLVERLGVAATCPPQRDESRHDEMRALFRSAFASRSQAEWVAIFAGTDACVAAVATLHEASQNAHLRERGTYLTRDGMLQPAPAPRFSRHQLDAGDVPDVPGRHTRDALASWGISDVDALIHSGAAFQA